MPSTVESTDRLLDELENLGSEVVVVRPLNLVEEAHARMAVLARYLKFQRDHLSIREHEMLNVVPVPR